MEANEGKLVEDRKRHSEAGSSVSLAVNGHRPTMGQGDALDNGKAKPGAAGCRDPRLVDSIETIEDAGQVLGIYPPAIVSDLNKARTLHDSDL